MGRDIIAEDLEEKDKFWSISGDYIYRDHVAPRGQLYVPSVPSFPTLLTKENLENLDESIIDDYWNVDVNETLSEYWIGFPRSEILQRSTVKVTKGLMEG